MNITVYCGSKTGRDPAYTEAAAALGQWNRRTGYEMVYGGGNIGLMSVTADIVLAGGRAVTGVIPEFLLQYETGHEGRYTLEVTRDMSQRKNRMLELRDVYLAMPGGTGTLEEIAEAISLQKLGRHEKPCIFYNINGFFDPLKQMFTSMVNEGFLRPEDQEKILFARSIEELDELLP